MTGENLDALKTRAARRARGDARRAIRTRRSICRSIASSRLPGLGTVVTGTLMQGTIAAGETLALEPGGKPAHVRSIGVFDATRERVESGHARRAQPAGRSIAASIARGHAIVGRELSARRRSSTVRFTPLAEAAPLLAPAHAGARVLRIRRGPRDARRSTTPLEAYGAAVRAASARAGRRFPGSALRRAPSVADDAARRRITSRCDAGRARGSRTLGRRRGARGAARAATRAVEWRDRVRGESARESRRARRSTRS